MRQALRVLAIVLALNVLAGAGWGAYEWRARGITTRHVREAFAVLVSKPAPALPPSSQPEATEPRTTPGADEPPVEIVREELIRREREVADQWALIRAAQLALLRDREAFEAEKKEFAAALEHRSASEGGSGYQRELAYLESVKPKLARDLLRQKKDVDVVEIMLAIDARVGRKIIDACRTEEERLWMGRILEQLRQRNDRQAEVLASGA